MLKQYSNIFRWLLMLSDGFLITIAFLAAYALKKHSIWLFPSFFYFFRWHFWLLVMTLAVWMSSLYIFNMYESFRLKRISNILLTILHSALVTLIAVSGISYFFKAEPISRTFLVYFFFAATVLMMIEKLFLVFVFRRLRAGGYNFRNILVVGTGQNSRKFVEYLDKNRELGLRVIGLVTEDDALAGKSVHGHHVLGTLEGISRILQEHVVDYAVFFVPSSSLGKIERALVQCELVGVTASVSMDLFNLNFTVGKESSIMGIPMITFEATPHSVSSLLVKRAIDVTVSLLALILIWPLYMLIAVCIKLTSPGPVYFVQERCGLNGRTFKLYKFRTMVVNAEARLDDLLMHNEMKGHAFKMKNDPRVTQIGKFLRILSLDELPQLWNVFHGDMSLVGPRPPLLREFKQYDPWHRRRLSMRPGITCLWQVGGRNRISDFDEWVRLDLEYIDNWSLWLDMKILLKTIPAVLSTAGAK